jgi:hypothetical protein
MRKAILLVAVMALFLVALPIGPASASPPEQVTFVGPAYFMGPDAGAGLFTATGPAVDSGAMCPGGTVLDVFGKLAPKMGQSPNGFNMQIVNEFTCGDGTGTFMIKLQVHITYYPTFNWVVVGGTGDYEDLRGNGDGYGDHPLFNGAPVPIGVWDVYEGKLH